VTFENLCVHKGKVTGVLVNRTTISGAIPVDPLVLQAETVINAPDAAFLAPRPRASCDPTAGV
jgi:ribulose 1,5-bisphosphate synthetase/thiazole synthase